MKNKIVALYLPQFYSFPENDKWWGKGFTEWTNVGKAKPLFKGHHQPRVPTDLGYYNLRMPEVREQQAEMARNAGVEGFMYWHYWFGNGKRLMWEVFDEVLKSGKPDFPFCLGWANHSWYAKNWNSDGTTGNDKLLIEQNYMGEEDYRMHYEYVVQAFKDDRYIKIDNKPWFHIYNPKDLPDDFISLWNKWSKEDGFCDGIYFTCRVDTDHEGNCDKDYWLKKGYSAILPDRLKDHLKRNELNYIINRLKEITKEFLHIPVFLCDYGKMYKYLVNKKYDNAEDVIPTVVPNYDHSPRSGKNGFIMVNSTPANFAKHLEDISDALRGKKNPICLLRSWNEWGEGNYVEPDMLYGDGYLEVIKKYFG